MKLILKLTILTIAAAPTTAKCSVKGCNDLTKMALRRMMKGASSKDSHASSVSNDSEDYIKNTETQAPTISYSVIPDAADGEDVTDSTGGNQSSEDGEQRVDSDSNNKDKENNALTPNRMKQCLSDPECEVPCFSAMNIVDVYGKGATTIDSLKIGDYVLTRNNQFSRVYSFCHKQKTLEATFLQIHTSSPHSPIEVSSKHMVFLDQQGMVPADSVKVGDTLTSYKVHDIKTVKRLGVYAPLTESGDLKVGKILASSYVAVYDESPLPFVNQHNLAHIIFASQRIACYFFFKLCEKEKYTEEEGYSEWTSAFIRFVILLKDFSPTVRMIVALLAMPTFFFVFTLEQLILHSTRLMIILLPLILFISYKTLIALRKKEKIL